MKECIVWSSLIPLLSVYSKRTVNLLKNFLLFDSTGNVTQQTFFLIAEPSLSLHLLSTFYCALKNTWKGNIEMYPKSSLYTWQWFMCFCSKQSLWDQKGMKHQDRMTHSNSSGYVTLRFPSDFAFRLSSKSVILSLSLPRSAHPGFCTSPTTSVCMTHLCLLWPSVGAHQINAQQCRWCALQCCSFQQIERYLH